MKIKDLPNFYTKIINKEDKIDFCIALYETFGCMFPSYRLHLQHESPQSYIPKVINRNYHKNYIVKVGDTIYVDLTRSSDLPYIDINDIEFRIKKTNKWLLRQKEKSE